MAVNPEGTEATGGEDAPNPLPPEAVVVASPPERRKVGRPDRSPYRGSRPRRPSAEESEAVRPLAPTRALRKRAAGFGVRHETVRAFLRGGASGAGSGLCDGTDGEAAAASSAAYGVGVPVGPSSTGLKTSGRGSGLVKPAWLGITTWGRVCASMTASAGTIPFKWRR